MLACLQASQSVDLNCGYESILDQRALCRDSNRPAYINQGRCEAMLLCNLLPGRYSVYCYRNFKKARRSRYADS